MSQLGTEAELLARLMEQARKSKREVVEEQPVPVESDDEVNLRTRLSKKRKVPAGSSTEVSVLTGLRVSEVVTATGMSVGDHVTATAKKTRVVASGAGETRPSKISQVAKEAQPRENRARAFDSVLRGLHNLYLVDSMEEDLRLKEQVAALEAGLLVEQTDRKNACRNETTLRPSWRRPSRRKPGP